MKNKDIITILYHIIHPEVSCSNPFTYKEVEGLFKFHSLEPFLFLAYKQGLLVTSPEEETKITKQYQIAIYKMSAQEEELKLIKETLTSNQILFLPIKGSWVRACYPSPELRTMADLDILVPKNKLKVVKACMLSLGYTSEHEGGNHDVYHKRPFMNVEMHRNMVDESYTLSKYYRNIWDRLNPNEGAYECALTPEDHYLFLIAHSAKHYGNGGTGVRSVLDIYFYWKKFPTMNKEYILEELHKLELVQYEASLYALSQSWFEGVIESEEITMMGEYLLSSGVYGTTTHAVASALSSMDEATSLSSRKWKYLWHRAFPPFKTMKQLYPSLKVFFVFLPFYYLHRLLKGLFTGKVAQQTQQLKHINEQQVQKNQQIKDKTGVQK
ncbi:MAG: nucleotidyltransferase family protein [Bacilli bacterium]|nr:nucleotidyltransferase family protein [Bacilli bacterium]